nr:MAG TPA: hypothetical protein [Caudoviricetes sp.]
MLLWSSAHTFWDFLKATILSNSKMLRLRCEN